VLEVLARQVRAQRPDGVLPLGQRLGLDLVGLCGPLLERLERRGTEREPAALLVGGPVGHEEVPDRAELVELHLETPEVVEALAALAEVVKAAAVDRRRGEDEIAQHGSSG